MKKISLKTITTASIAVLLSVITLTPAQALTLSFLGTFSTEKVDPNNTTGPRIGGGGAGIAFDPATGDIFVSDGENISAAGGSTISRYNFSFDSNTNTFTASYSTEFIKSRFFKGLHGLGTNLLMSQSEASNANDRLLEVTTSGTEPGGGINLMIDDGSGTNNMEAKGVTIGPNGNYLVADEGNSRILEIEDSGVNAGDILNVFDMTSLTGSGFISDLEGLAYYKDDTLFVVSDSNGGSGKATVYELDISGGLSAASFVSKTFLGANDGSFGNLDDPEGLAIDLANNLLFVSDNAGDEVGVYHIVPIPGALVLLGSALLGLIGATRRKHVVSS